MTRENAIKQLKRMLIYMEHADDVNAIKFAIKELPSVQPKKRTGEWIDHQEGRWIYAKCSMCGTTHDARSNYCPNCGSLMKG